MGKTIKKSHYQSLQEITEKEPIDAKTDSDLDDDIGEVAEDSENENMDNTSEEKTETPILRMRAKKSTAAKI